MTERTEKRRILLQGTFILSLAALFTKILSAVYRIPFQNIVGDIGFYIYQQVYPFYGIAIALATYGFPVIISKLYAERLGENQKSNHLLVPIFLGIFLLCFILFFCIHYFSTYIATTMGDPKLEPMISLVAFSFLLVPFLSVLRGYFQGKGMMTPTAISQVGEQFIRVTFIIITAVLFTNLGKSLYSVGQGAILSSIFGSLFAIFILIRFFIKHNKDHVKEYFPIKIKEGLSIIKVVIIQGLAICISSLTLVLFQMSDAFQILSILTKQGMPIEQAQQIKGVYDRGQPLLQLGLVLATSLSLSIVPIIASLKKKGREITSYIRLSFRISLSVGAAATIGLILIMDEVNTMLFQNEDGSNVLRTLALAIVLASISMTISSILQGLGDIYYPALIVLFGVIIKTILNKIFIGHWGASGAAVATVVALVFILLFLFWRLHKNIPIRFLQSRFIIVLAFSLCAMVIAVLFVQSVGYFAIDYFTGTRIFASMLSIIAALFGGIVFLISMLRGGIFTKEEIQVLPLGEKLERIVKSK